MEPKHDQPNFDLVVYKLDTLTEAVRDGFKGVDAKFNAIDSRLLTMELWRAQTEPFVQSLIEKAQRETAAHESESIGAQDAGIAINRELIVLLTKTLAIVTATIGVIAWLVQH